MRSWDDDEKEKAMCRSWDVGNWDYWDYWDSHVAQPENSSLHLGRFQHMSHMRLYTFVYVCTSRYGRHNLGHAFLISTLWTHSVARYISQFSVRRSISKQFRALVHWQDMTWPLSDHLIVSEQTGLDRADIDAAFIGYIWVSFEYLEVFFKYLQSILEYRCIIHICSQGTRHRHRHRHKARTTKLDRKRLTPYHGYWYGYHVLRTEGDSTMYHVHMRYMQCMR